MTKNQSNKIERYPIGYKFSIVMDHLLDLMTDLTLRLGHSGVLRILVNYTVRIRYHKFYEKVHLIMV